jgi:hypothetical protein
VKNIFSIFLLCIFCQLLLVGPIFLVQQERWKEHMMAEIKRNVDDFQVEAMFFSKAEYEKLSWREGHKEFVFNGAFYDVLAINTVSGGKEIRCVHDMGEDALVERYIQEGRGHNNPLHHMVKVLWTNLSFEVTPAPELVLNDVRFLKDKNHSLYCFSIKESENKPQSPPPNFF